MGASPGGFLARGFFMGGGETGKVFDFGCLT